MSITAYDKQGRTFYKVAFRVKKYDGNTKQIHKQGFKTKREAEKYILETKAKYEGTATVPLRIVADDYMKHAEEEDFSPNTIRNKRPQVKRIIEAFGNFPICDITPLMIREWQEDMARKVRPQTANVYKMNLSCIFKYAMTYYGLKENPAKLASSLRVKDSDKKKKNIWKDEDLRKALEYVQNTCFRVLLQLLYYSALRIGEALGLEPKDILEDGIMVRRQRIGGAQTKEPKRGSSGKVLLHPDMIRILKDYVDRTGITEGAIFPYGSEWAREHLKKICDNVDVPRITLHDLRHSSLTNDANRGTPLMALQAKARHKSATTTGKYYLHLNEDTQQMLNFGYSVIDAEPMKPEKSRQKKHLTNLSQEYHANCTKIKEKWLKSSGNEQNVLVRRAYPVYTKARQR